MIAEKTVTITPTKGRLIVQRKPQDERISKGGIVIPGSTNDSTEFCLVLKAHGTFSNVAEVLINLFSGTKFTEDGEDFYVVKEEDVLAIVTEIV